MELKLGNHQPACSSIGLLIVPYGIETPYPNLNVRNKICLLIVPYGIETYFCTICRFKCSLLIVPYGIETYHF